MWVDLHFLCVGHDDSGLCNLKSEEKTETLSVCKKRLPSLHVFITQD